MTPFKTSAYYQLLKKQTQEFSRTCPFSIPLLHPGFYLFTLLTLVSQFFSHQPSLLGAVSKKFLHSAPYLFFFYLTFSIALQSWEHFRKNHQNYYPQVLTKRPGMLITLVLYNLFQLWLPFLLETLLVSYLFSRALPSQAQDQGLVFFNYTFLSAVFSLVCLLLFALAWPNKQRASSGVYQREVYLEKQQYRYQLLLFVCSILTNFSIFFYQEASILDFIPFFLLLWASSSCIHLGSNEQYWTKLAYPFLTLLWLTLRLPLEHTEGKALFTFDYQSWSEKFNLHYTTEQAIHFPQQWLSSWDLFDQIGIASLLTLLVGITITLSLQRQKRGHL